MSAELTAEQRIAANLKAIREENRMTQEDVAEAMSKRGYRWHQATVYKVENGSRQVQLGEATALAEVFDVPLSQLAASTQAAVGSARLSWLDDLTKQARRDVVMAVRGWQFEQRRLAEALSSNSWGQGEEEDGSWPGGDLGPFASPKVAFSALPNHTQNEIRRRASETVEDVLALPDDKYPF